MPKIEGSFTVKRKASLSALLSDALMKLVGKLLHDDDVTRLLKLKLGANESLLLSNRQGRP